jgi:hypothetical protein
MIKPRHYIKLVACIGLVLAILGCATIGPDGSNIDPKGGEGRADKGQSP